MRQAGKINWHGEIKKWMYSFISDQGMTGMKYFNIFLIISVNEIVSQSIVTFQKAKMWNAFKFFHGMIGQGTPQQWHKEDQIFLQLDEEAT